MHPEEQDSIVRPETSLRTPNRRSKIWSVDAWLFLILVGGYGLFAAFRFDSFQERALPLGLATFLILLYFLFPKGRLRSVLAVVAIAIVAVAPTILGIQLRRATAPYDYAFDGLIQLEEAVKFLLDGTNPYATTYEDTPLAEWPRAGPNPAENPPVFHLIQLPFVYLFWVPFFLLAEATIGWFDGRFVLLALFLIMLDLLRRLAPTGPRARAVMLAIGLNPWLAPFLAEGQNGVSILFWVVLAVFLLRRGRRTLSVVTLALACAGKLTAWFILPFYAFYFLYPERHQVAWRWPGFYTRLRKALPHLLLFVAVFSAVILPFLFWDPAAFVEDIVLFPAGRTERTFPIIGIGFARLALEAGWHPDAYVPFPALPFQLLFGIPVLLVGWRWQARRNNIGTLLLAGGALGLVVGFFAHIFHANHFGFYVSLLVMGWLLQNSQGQTSADRRSLPPEEGIPQMAAGTHRWEERSET